MASAARAAAGTVLYDLIAASPHTFKSVAEQVGERRDTLSTRLRHPHRRGYGLLDVGMVLAILDVIGVPFTEYARRVEEWESAERYAQTGGRKPTVAARRRIAAALNRAEPDRG